MYFRGIRDTDFFFYTNNQTTKWEINNYDSCIKKKMNGETPNNLRKSPLRKEFVTRFSKLV